mmetsp:Transcript_1146/g.4250  ORF Transcript_1146/g.4250 Transcript_1146/m.4250 type:complete len:292 (-) Transcript_1146:228-1103(-)
MTCQNKDVIRVPEELVAQLPSGCVPGPDGKVGNACDDVAVVEAPQCLVHLAQRTIESARAAAATPDGVQSRVVLRAQQHVLEAPEIALGHMALPPNAHGTVARRRHEAVSGVAELHEADVVPVRRQLANLTKEPRRHERRSPRRPLKIQSLLLHAPDVHRARARPRDEILAIGIEGAVQHRRSVRSGGFGVSSGTSTSDPRRLLRGARVPEPAGSIVGSGHQEILNLWMEAQRCDRHGVSHERRERIAQGFLLQAPRAHEAVVRARGENGIPGADRNLGNLALMPAARAPQ